MDTNSLSLEDALSRANEYRCIPQAARSGYQADAIALADAYAALQEQNNSLSRRLASHKARIDALMLEFCPDEMTAEQKAEWAGHQRIQFGCHCGIAAIGEDFEPDACVMDDHHDQDCTHAELLRTQGKTKMDCQYWQPIRMAPRVSAALRAARSIAVS